MNMRAAKGGGTATDISAQANAPGMMQRLRTAFQYISTGSTDWFGPRDPMPPVAPAEVKEQGRAMDYPVGYNQNLQPRAMEPIGFEHLRTLADSYDLMRLIIETRKDQVSRMKWNIKPRKEGVQSDARCEKIAEALRKPDREHDWDTWMRALLEDMLVIDAATIYPRKTRGGEFYSLDLIDGATIKRVIGEDGRTPMAPEPAYQQVLKGVPAANFTVDELFYRMRNWRVHRMYGYSPVEQVIMTVNIALRRQLHQLQYYTEGNVPEALIGVPENWTVEQIKQFQNYWDSLMEGNTAQRRHAKFVPGNMEYQPTKEQALKDMYDEWLARVICFAFSVSPNAFIAQVNRATAETSQEAAKEEGLAPILTWLKNTMDNIVAQVFGAPDLEFAWAEEVNLDPKTKADVHSVYITAEVMTPDEVRQELGMEPMTPEQREKIKQDKMALKAGPPKPGEEGGGPKPGEKGASTEEEGGGTEKGDYLGDVMKRGAARPKSVSRVAPINRERPAALKAQEAIRSATEDAFDAVCKEAIDACESIGKAGNDGKAVADALRLRAFDELAKALAAIFTEFVQDAGREALAQVNIDDPEIVTLTNERAVAWAKDHAAELVGKKWVGGKLVDNPDAAYRIDTVTRDGVRALVQQATDEGWSNDKLSKSLREAYTFSKERADLVAVTETAFVDVQGNMLAYKDSGVVEGKRWIVGSSEKLCPSCLTNKQQGVIALDKAFASGHMAPPGHPRCRCDVLPVTKSKNRG
jgi:SPP1 gp7 family putative phage head morphogenesis protein